MNRVGGTAGAAIGFKLCGPPCAAVGSEIGKVVLGKGSEVVGSYVKRKFAKYFPGTKTPTTKTPTTKTRTKKKTKTRTKKKTKKRVVRKKRAPPPSYAQATKHLTGTRRKRRSKPY
jgi:hypothetical protein